MAILRRDHVLQGVVKDGVFTQEANDGDNWFDRESSPRVIYSIIRSFGDSACELLPGFHTHTYGLVYPEDTSVPGVLRFRMTSDNTLATTSFAMYNATKNEK